jgi:D-alanyl-D-alanine carboxypeptidase
MKTFTFFILAFIAIALYRESAIAQHENILLPKERPGQGETLKILPIHKALHHLDYSLKAIDPSLAQALQYTLDSVRVAENIKGISAAMIIPGQGLWIGTSGYSVPSTSDTITSDMLFGIGSNTKTFIATTMLQLQEEGVLSLDDPLCRWLPTYRQDQYRYIDSNITIRQLLNHTSGIYNYAGGEWARYRDSLQANPARFWEPESLLAIFMRPPNFSLGTSYSYCNTNYLLAGMIIKVATGTSVSLQLHQRFLTPLNLSSTYLAVEDSLVGVRAHPWGSWDFASDNIDFYSFPIISMYSFPWTAGAMFSIPENMVRWIYNLYGGNVLKDSSLTQMLTFTAESGGYYGLGIGKENFDGITMIGHSGGWYGYTSEMLFNPESHLCVATTENSNNVSWWLTPHLLSTYLRYGAPIYAVSLDKTSFTPVTDTLFATCYLRNPESHPFSIKAYYLLGDNISDSSVFFDDGLHHDSLPGDGLWGTQWVIPPEENMYSLTVTPYDSAADYSFTLNKVVCFTAGNLMSVDSIMITRISPSWLKAQVWVRNNSHSSPIPSVHADVVTTDPNIKEFNYSDYDYGDLPPAQRSVTPGVFTFKVDTSLKTADLQLSLDITSNDIKYWTLDFIVPLRITPTFSRSNIDFGTVGIGETKLDSVILRNPNSLSLNVVSASSDLPTEYTVVPSSAVIAPLDSQKFYVTFNPTTIGVHAGHLVFSYEGTGSPVQMNITGTFSPPSTRFAVSIGWNMVSIPMLPFSYLKNTLFSTTVSPAYTYQTAYTRRDTLSIGVGYWVKYATSEIAEIPGVAIFSDTFDVNEGWNMIGSVSEPIKVTNIGSIPAGIITSGFYFYGGDDYYDVVDTIKPGYGYWVKVNQPGKLILSATSKAKASNLIRIIASNEQPPPPPDGKEITMTNDVPAEYLLEQNYPNPFNPGTTISYSVPERSRIVIEIYNVLGQIVATVVNGEQEPGYRSVDWVTTGGLGSGLYFYRLTASSMVEPGWMFVQVRKMVLLK